MSEITKDWCLNMAEREGNAEIGAGSPDHILRPDITARARAHVAAMAIVQANPIEALARLTGGTEREDTVAFVQEWMMSGDHEAGHWERSFARAIDARRVFTDVELYALAERFCTTALPETVRADLVSLKQMPGRTGTNLMTVAEAKTVLSAVLSPTSETDQLGGVGV